MTNNTASSRPWFSICCVAAVLVVNVLILIDAITPFFSPFGEWTQPATFMSSVILGIVILSMMRQKAPQCSVKTGESS